MKQPPHAPDTASGLAGKVALVMGAGSGLGRDTAMGLTALPVDGGRLA